MTCSGPKEYIEGGAFVDLVSQLVDVPVGAQEGCDDDADVGADAFDFLGVPERVGIVVFGGEEDGVGRAAFEVVDGEVSGEGLFAAVVVVPFLLTHDHGDDETDAESKIGVAK